MSARHTLQHPGVPRLAAGRSKSMALARCRPLRTALCALAIAVTVFAGAAPGLAQAPGPPSPGVGANTAVRDDVRKLHNTALAALKRGDIDVAYKGFLEAWARQKVPRIALNLGRAELSLKKHRAAAEHLHLFLRLDTEMTPEERKEVEGFFTEARKHISTIRVNVLPAGADVFLDGENIGRAPLEDDLFVDPGHHTIEARTAKAAEKTEIDTLSGAESSVTLDAKERVIVKPPPPPAPSPRTPAPAPPSARPIRVVLLAVGAGAAVAGLGVGAGAWAAVEGKNADLDAICRSRECPNSGSRDYSSQRAAWTRIEGDRANLARVSAAGFFAGSAVGLATLGYLIFGSKAPVKSTGVNFTITPGGVQASGHW